MEECESIPCNLTPENDELQDFVYAVSHDLQAPLRHVRSFLTLLSPEHTAKLNEEGQQFVSIAANSANHLQSMLDVLLKFSRLSSDTAEFTVVDLDTCLEHICAAKKQSPNGYQLVCQALPQVTGCAEQLRSLFQCLLENVEHHNSNFEELTVTISAEQDTEFALITVSDNGIGIPPEHRQRVFEMFQTYKANKDQHLGAGLSIARRIAQLHQGSLTYEKADNRNGEFKLKLKLARPTQ